VSLGGTRAGLSVRRTHAGLSTRGTLADRLLRRWRVGLSMLIAVAALAIGLPACGASAPHSSSTTSVSPVEPGTSASIVARANRTHEVPTPAGPQAVAGGWRSPTQAVYVFASQYINWNSQNVSVRLRALARVSVGQARSAASAAASETASDDELKQGQIANSGVVEAIAPVIGHRYEYAVATRERTTASATDAYQGLGTQWHLAVATVTRLTGGLWVLSNWQPEN
jgi:hypothetical protein